MLRPRYRSTWAMHANLAAFADKWTHQSCQWAQAPLGAPHRSVGPRCSCHPCGPAQALCAASTPQTTCSWQCLVGMLSMSGQRQVGPSAAGSSLWAGFSGLLPCLKTQLQHWDIVATRLHTKACASCKVAFTLEGGQQSCPLSNHRVVGCQAGCIVEESCKAEWRTRVTDNWLCIGELCAETRNVFVGPPPLQPASPREEGPHAPHA